MTEPGSPPLMRKAGLIRRALALAIDLLLLYLAGTVIDNLVTARVPNSVMVLAAAAVFLAYYTLTEGFGSKRASLGKRVCRIAVVRRDGRKPDRLDIVQRALLWLPMLWVDWSIFGSLWFPLSGVASGLFLYTAFTSWRDPDGLGWPDRYTYTRVVRSRTLLGDAPYVGPNPEPLWPHPKLAVALLSVALVAGFSLPRLPWIRPLLEMRAQVASLASLFPVRSQVSANSLVARTANGAPVSRLRIVVWIPYAAWNAPTHQEIVKTVATHLSPGNVARYNYVFVVITTGARAFGISQVYVLKQPAGAARGGP